MGRPTKTNSFAVYPPDFYHRGHLWTFRAVMKARSKARSLGKGAWIRRYVDAIDKDTGKRVFVIDRLWQWNGVKFVRILAEPTPDKSRNRTSDLRA